MTGGLGRRSAVVGSWLAFTGVATAVGLAAVDLVANPLQANTSAAAIDTSLEGGPDGQQAAPEVADSSSSSSSSSSAASPTSTSTSRPAKRVRPAAEPTSPATSARAGSDSTAANRRDTGASAARDADSRPANGRAAAPQRDDGAVVGGGRGDRSTRADTPSKKRRASTASTTSTRKRRPSTQQTTSSAPRPKRTQRDDRGGDRPKSTKTSRPRRSTSDSSPSSTSSRRPTSESTPTSSPKRTRTFQTEGGAVTAQCQGRTVRLLSWSPAGGYAVKDADPGPDDKARVRFESDEVEIRVDVRCSGGVPTATVERHT